MPNNTQNIIFFVLFNLISVWNTIQKSVIKLIKIIALIIKI